MTKKGRPKTDTQPVMLRISGQKIALIDEIRKNTDGLPTRPEVIRRIVDHWLDENDPQKGLD